jgi:CO/xanthine dehydrogenase FAD-binding subunit
VIAALGAGRRAADSIDQHLSKLRGGADAGTTSPGATPTSEDRQGLQVFDPECLAPSAGATPALAALEDRSLEDEDEALLDAEAVLGEAHRCFNCGCVAVSPSDLAPALVALNATMVTSRRELPASMFFAAASGGSTVLAPDEIVLGVDLPAPDAGWRSAFSKFRLRNSIDFPIVSAAVAIRLDEERVADARIVLGAMAPIPVRASDAESVIIGTSAEEVLGGGADRCAEAAIAGCLPLSENAYKLTIARSLVGRLVARLVT